MYFVPAERLFRVDPSARTAFRRGRAFPRRLRVAPNAGNWRSPECAALPVSVHKYRYPIKAYFAEDEEYFRLSIH
ncbi:hypothetical protein K9U39_14145 [Rhodoblastus acidophilus]|nr:hypothetical protein [Rhodoblastus acidophilus]